MLDINLIRAHADELKTVCKQKNKDPDVIDRLLTIDDRRRTLQKQIDDLKFAQKKAGEAKDIEKAKGLKTEVQALEVEQTAVEQEHTTLLRKLPNFTHPDVPVGKDESENIVIKKVGEIPVFDFPVKDHEELGLLHNCLDKEQATKVTGSRFYYLKGDFAMLQNAMVQYVFSVLTNREILQKIINDNKLTVPATPFTMVIPPLFINYETGNRMGRLQPMDERYCFETDKFMLIGSAEHSLGPIHMDQVLDEKDCPIRYFAYTPAFRREAGTYGKDTRGVFRVHQFDKIEMETFVPPSMGEAEQDFIVAIQEYILQSFELPYQKVLICTGDMGSMDYRQYDMETYMPGQGKYRETHTSDWMTDYQARRLNIKIKLTTGDKVVCHMNDATALAMPRGLIAMIENNQQADGSIRIPKVLQPYMGGRTVIGKK